MLRRLLTRCLAVAALAFGLAAGQASATTYALGDLTALGSHSGASGTFAAGVAFSDSWTFTLSGGANTFTGLFTSVFTPLSGLFGSLSIVLHGPGGSVPWSIVTTPGPSGVQYSFLTGILPTGAYSLDISGVAIHPASYSIDLAAAIPEPGQWLMLFAGIALIGAIIRRRAR